MSANTHRSLIHIYINIIAALSFMLIIYSGAIAPLTSDDWLGYALKADRSFTEFILYSYQGWMGRIQGLTIGYYSIGICEKTIFGAMNGLGFMSLVFLSFLLAKGRWPNLFSSDQVLFLILTAALWFALPTIGQTVFWRSGATVYLWPCFFASVYLLPYRFELCRINDQKVSISRKFIYSSIMLLLGVWVGFSHEQIFVSVLAFVCICFYFFYKEGKIRDISLWLISGLFGLLLGGAIMILAPGNLVRYNYYQNQTIIDKLNAVTSYLFSVVTGRASGEYWNTLIPWIIILFIFSIICRPHKHHDDSKIFLDKKDRMLFFSFATAASAALVPILVLASFAAARTAFFSIYFLIIAMASLAHNRFSDFQSNHHSKIAITIVIILSINAVFLDSLITATRMWKIKYDIETREHYLKKLIDNGQRDIEIAPISTKPGRTIYFEDISNNPKIWFNVHMAKYYGINSIKVNGSCRDDCVR